MVKVGDRVWLWLPYRTGPKGGGVREVKATGTVTGVDTARTAGVDIALDFEVNGARSCYAAHAEVHPLEAVAADADQ